MKTLLFERKGVTPLILFLIVITLLPLASSASPFISASDNGCQITPIVRDTLSVNQAFDFNFHVFNFSNGVPLSNTTLSCYFHLYNQTGDHSYSTTLKNDPYSEHQVINEWAARLSETNFSSSGYYAYLVQCNGTQMGCEDKGAFKVIDNVVTDTASSDWRIFVILILLAMSLLVFSLWSESYAFSFITGAAFILAGVYSMIYGFDGVTDVYTRAIGFILLGIGVILAIISAFGMVGDNYGNKEEDDE